MAVVLVARPWGLMGKPPAPAGHAARPERPITPPASACGWRGALLALLIAAPLLGQQWPYLAILLTEILIAALFAASLHFLTGLAGMTSSATPPVRPGRLRRGAAALARRAADGGRAAAGAAGAALGALVFGWFCVRLSGVYLAMLTLAVAQILWATAFQWDDVTGGSNGLTGLWPAAWLSSGPGYYYLTLALCALGVWWLRRLAFAPLRCAARRARLGPARRSAGHGRAPRAMGGLRGCLAGRRHGRFAVRLFQGQHRA